MTNFTQLECLETFIQAQKSFTIEEHKINLTDIINNKSHVQELSETGLALLQRRLKSNETNVSNQLLLQESPPNRNLELIKLSDQIKLARKTIIPISTSTCTLPQL